MKRLLKVQVTQNDIDTGLAGNPCLCPIGLAMNRLELGYDCIDVGTYNILCWNWENTKTLTLKLPEKAHQFIINFDRYGNCFPFEFNLEVVENES